MTQPPTGILVIGAHRSGTSAIARTLGLMGAAEAPRLMAPNDANPSGYWEAEAVVDAHDRFLAAIGSRWDDPRPLAANAFAGGPADIAHTELLAFLQEAFADERLFVIKDPRLCRTAPLMLGALATYGAAAWIVAPFRAPAAAIRSMAARDGYSELRCTAIWLGGVLESERLTRGVPRQFVNYGRFAEDPVAGARQFADALGGFGEAAAADAVAGAITDYWAGAGRAEPRPTLEPGPFTDLADEVYAALLAGPAPDAARMDAAGERFRRLLRTAKWRRAAMGDGLRELAGRVARKIAGG
jgi:hypothetical protein